MKINKISSKLIKPHTPTPHDLKNYKLSFIDKDVLNMNIGVVLFYKSKPKDYTQQLKESLANILVDFYPLAGRYNKHVNDLVIDCNDEGAQLVEAEVVDVELIDLVGQAEIGPLFPDQHFKVDVAADYPLLSIQATCFPCGGVAIAVSIPQLVFDMSSVTTFIVAWSSACNNKMVGGRISPSFQLSSLLPCKADGESSIEYRIEDRKVVRKRLFFHKVALAGLKSKIRPRKGGKSVSGVRVVCALVAKALIGVDRAKHGRSRDFVMSSPVNMRGRTVFLPQPKHSCGNFAMAMITRRVAASEAESIGIQQLYDLLGDGAHKTISDFAEILSPPATNGLQVYKNHTQHLIKEVSTPETNVILFSDCSKFGYHEADFGWGTPVWTSIGPLPLCWTTFMRNKEGDGIDVLVHLNPDEVTYFEQDQEIKKFMMKPPVTDNANKTTMAVSRSPL